MKYFLCVALTFVIYSCSKKKHRVETIEIENLTTQQIDSILTKFNFQYESPIVLHSTNQVLIPISTKLLKRKKTLSKEGYNSDDYPRYWNVVFYNIETGEHQLLTERKVRISEIYFNTDENNRQHNIMKDKVIFEIGDDDYNNDGKINSNDPEYLFCSDLNGMNLTRISPKDEDLQDFKIISKSNEILIKTLRDSKEDSVFNSEDESILYKATLSNQKWTLKEVIDSIGRQNIENLYLKQWVKNNSH